MSGTRRNKVNQDLTENASVLVRILVGLGNVLGFGRLSMFLALTPLTVCAIIATLWTNSLGQWIALITLGTGASLWLIALWLRTIPADPPYVGEVTVWGVPTGVVLEAGERMLAGFPFNFGLIQISLQDQPLNFVYNEIACRATSLPKGKNVDDPEGGTDVAYVRATVAVTAAPDVFDHSNGKRVQTGRVREYLQAGREEGIRGQLQEMVGQILREQGARHSWQEMQFAKDRLSALIIWKLTGLNEVNGKAVDLEQAPDSEIQKFLRSALVNGVSDVHSLGATVKRISVDECVVVGPLREDADRKAREDAQAAAERRETENVISLAKAYMDAAPGLTFQEAINLVQTERNKARRFIIDGSASDRTRPFINLGEGGLR